MPMGAELFGERNGMRCLTFAWCRLRGNYVRSCVSVVDQTLDYDRAESGLRRYRLLEQTERDPRGENQRYGAVVLCAREVKCSGERQRALPRVRSVRTNVRLAANAALVACLLPNRGETSAAPPEMSRACFLSDRLRYCDSSVLQYESAQRHRQQRTVQVFVPLLLARQPRRAARIVMPHLPRRAPANSAQKNNGAERTTILSHASPRPLPRKAHRKTCKPYPGFACLACGPYEVPAQSMSRLTGVRAGDVVHKFCRPVPACLFKTLYADHLLPQACAGKAHPHVCIISPLAACAKQRGGPPR
ncbi:hypothetical protein L1887_54408 [Cichorium endivia]|nr:hypothetical protein L1887_54408 [Cichorium endivia]